MWVMLFLCSLSFHQFSCSLHFCLSANARRLYTSFQVCLTFNLSHMQAHDGCFLTASWWLLCDIYMRLRSRTFDIPLYVINIVRSEWQHCVGNCSTTSRCCWNRLSLIGSNIFYHAFIMHCICDEYGFSRLHLCALLPFIHSWKLWTHRSSIRSRSFSFIFVYL